MKRCLLECLWLLYSCVAWAQPPVPLLWKVSDADNSVYLLGSMHLLTEADYPLAPVVDAAFADSAQLVFEVSPDHLDPARVGQAVGDGGDGDRRGVGGQDAAFADHGFQLPEQHTLGGQVLDDGLDHQPGELTLGLEAVKACGAVELQRGEQALEVDGHRCHPFLACAAGAAGAGHASALPQ